MSYDSGRDHSLAALDNSQSFHNPSITSERGQAEIFRKIASVLSTTEVVWLCDTIRTLPHEAILQSIQYHCLESASSAPEHLSLITDCHSQPFAPSWGDDILPHAASDKYDQSEAQTGPGGTAFHSCNLRKPDALALSAIWNVCMACDQSYAHPAGLAKHQRTGCEGTRHWKCSYCRQQIFENLSQLHQHYLSIHSDRCPECRKVVKSPPCDRCKAILSRCSTEIMKKAWGCPCCIECFDSLRDWNKHQVSHWHQLENERLPSWSFSTMVRSLLRHRDLLTASHRYNWSLCNWAHMGKNECQTLRFALERHIIPSTMFSNEIYSRLGMPDSLVWHTFTLGTVGHTSLGPLNPTGFPRVASPLPVYKNLSFDQVPEFQPMNLGFQQRDSIERGHNFESDENSQHPSHTFSIAPDEAADDEEVARLAVVPEEYTEEYRRAAGTFKTMLRDDRWDLRTQQGPAPLANYIPSSQSRHNLPVNVVHPRRRVRGRTPIGKTQYMKQKTRNQYSAMKVVAE